MNKLTLNNVKMNLKNSAIDEALESIKNNSCRLPSGTYVGQMYIGDLKVKLALKKPHDIVSLNYEVHVPAGLLWSKYCEETLIDHSTYLNPSNEIDHTAFKQNLLAVLEERFEKDEILSCIGFYPDQFVYRGDLANILNHRYEMEQQTEYEEEFEI